MRKVLLLAGVLAVLVPGALAQRDIDGNTLGTEVKVGTSYEGGRSSEVGTVDIKRRLTDALAVEGIINGGEYYGNGPDNDLKSFAGVGLSATYSLNPNFYVSAGGLRNTVNADTPIQSAFAEVGHLLHSGGGFFRAIEGDYNQTYWSYGVRPAATANLFSPRVILYLPREFDIMIQSGIAKTAIGGMSNMKMSEAVRFRIPLTRRFSLTASAGFNSVSMIQVAQVSGLSTRNYGAGLRAWVNRTLSVEAAGTKSYGTFDNLPDGTVYGVSITKRF